MEAARAAGLDPPTSWLSEDLNTFVIERFDYEGEDKLNVRVEFLRKRMVPGAGIEPARCCHQGILSLYKSVLFLYFSVC